MTPAERAEALVTVVAGRGCGPRRGQTQTVYTVQVAGVACPLMVHSHREGADADAAEIRGAIAAAIRAAIEQRIDADIALDKGAS